LEGAEKKRAEQKGGNYIIKKEDSQALEGGTEKKNFLSSPSTGSGD